MAAYRRVYDSRHLQADCQEPGSAPEPYAQSSTGYLHLYLVKCQLIRRLVYRSHPIKHFNKNKETSFLNTTVTEYTAVATVTLYVQLSFPASGFVLVGLKIKKIKTKTDMEQN